MDRADLVRDGNQWLAVISTVIFRER